MQGQSGPTKHVAGQRPRFRPQMSQFFATRAQQWQSSSSSRFLGSWTRASSTSSPASSASTVSGETTADPLSLSSTGMARHRRTSCP